MGLKKAGILLLFLVQFFLSSCKKEKLEVGVYQFSASSLEYSYNEVLFTINDFSPKEVILIEKSEFLLEFDYFGKMNYLTVDNKNITNGLWVFDDTVPGTNSLLGYNISGQIKKEKRNWFIEGNINFIGRHIVDSVSHNVNVDGDFVLRKN